MTAWHAASATAVYAAATVYFTWPLARLSEDYIFPRVSPDDILLVLWILSWDVHAIQTDITRFFDGNILHPAPGILAHSEHLLGTLPFFAPPCLATGNPVLALNVMMLASFVLGGLFMHLMILAWTGSALAGYVAGLSFAFAPWRINGLNWPHLLSTQYLPLVLLGLDRTLTTRRRAAMALVAVALSLQLLASFYLAQMAVIVVGAFVVSNLGSQGRLRSREAWFALMAGLALPIASLLLVSMPYLEVQRAGLLQRPQAPDQALDILATFGRPAAVLRGFVGWGPAVLAVFALAAAVFRPDAYTRRRIVTLGLVLVCALAISPGPRGFLGGVISVYSWLAAAVPGFTLVRVPFRFGILASFAASAMAGFGTAAIVRLLRAAPALLRGSLVPLAIGCALYPAWQTRVPAPMTLPTRGDLAPAHAWLAAHGEGGALLELPMQERRSASGWVWDRVGARAMYFSTYHWLPLLNGYTGYMPPTAIAVESMAGRLPALGALQDLVDCANLRWILVHGTRPELASAWQNAEGVRLVGRFVGSRAEDRLYEVVLGRRGSCTDDRFAGGPGRAPVRADG